MRTTTTSGSCACVYDVQDAPTIRQGIPVKMSMALKRVAVAVGAATIAFGCFVQLF